VDVARQQDRFEILHEFLALHLRGDTPERPSFSPRQLQAFIDPVEIVTTRRRTATARRPVRVVLSRRCPATVQRELLR